MSIYEYDYEKHMKMEREQHFAEGLAQGEKQNALDNARSFFENGASFELVRNSIKNLTDEELHTIYDEITRR